MARGVIRGLLAGLSVGVLGLAVASAVAPPPQAPVLPVPAAAKVATAEQVAAQPALPGAQAIRFPQPAAALPRPVVQATLPATAADSPPVRPKPLPLPGVPAVPASIAVRPLAVSPVPLRRTRAEAGAVTSPVPVAAAPGRLARPVALLAGPAETVPSVPSRAALPAIAALPGLAARASAGAAAAAPPAVPGTAAAPDVLSRSSANPALVLPGDAPDDAPRSDAAARKPVVRRAGDAKVAQADPPAPLLKKPEPLAPAPGLQTQGAPQTEGTLPPREDLPDAAAAPAADAPPRIAYARVFDNPAQKPLLSIILFDTGAPELDRTALAAVPFPVTFVLDPSRPESALAASIYRAGGQEVAMLATGIPQGATASDVEVTFGAHAGALPESVAVVVPEVDGFQDNRPVSTLVVPVVAGQGRGILSWDRGLNAADQVARREGAFAATIFRRLDGDGEDVPRIRQYLDRAAFKAAQEGRVVVAGETRPETVQALLAWAVEGRASSVALAPLTAALQAQ
jgi:hypothetical protein